MSKTFLPTHSISICALGSLYFGEKPRYLHAALDSIRRQSVTIPIFLVVDGPISTELEDVLGFYDDLNIEFFRLPKNIGLGRALNVGLKELASRFDYLIRFDTDDINLPNRFEVLINFFERQPCDLVSSHMIEIDAEGIPCSKRRVPLTYKKILRQLTYRSAFNHPASAFRIQACSNVGGYKHMPFLEDWYLWTRMSHKGYVLRNVDEYLVDYRVTNDTIKRRYGLKYIKCEINFFHARAREGLVPLIPNYGALVLRIIIKLFGFFVYKKLFKLTRRIF